MKNGRLIWIVLGASLARFVLAAEPAKLSTECQKSAEKAAIARMYPASAQEMEKRTSAKNVGHIKRLPSAEDTEVYEAEVWLEKPRGTTCFKLTLQKRECKLLDVTPLDKRGQPCGE